MNRLQMLNTGPAHRRPSSATPFPPGLSLSEIVPSPSLTPWFRVAGPSFHGLVFLFIFLPFCYARPFLTGFTSSRCRPNLPCQSISGRAFSCPHHSEPLPLRFCLCISLLFGLGPAPSKWEPITSSPPHSSPIPEPSLRIAYSYGFFFLTPRALP